jgi:hypothetical protein
MQTEYWNPDVTNFVFCTKIRLLQWVKGTLICTISDSIGRKATPGEGHMFLKNQKTFTWRFILTLALLGVVFYAAPVGLVYVNVRK